MPTALRKALATVWALPATISVTLIRAYQLVLSPDHGPLRHLYPYGFCRHEPTCSAYAIETIRKERFPLAVYLSVRRVLTCNPWRKPTDAKLKTVIKKISA